MAPRKPRILFIDDVLSSSGLAEFLLQPLGAEIDCAESAEQALAHLDSKRAYDVVVSDVALPGISGFDLVQLLRQRKCEVPVILITGYNDAKTAELAREVGAFDFVPKPMDPQVFRLVVRRALEPRGSEAEAEALRRELPRALDGCEIIGDSKAMAAVYAFAVRVARSDANVCIYGESGTGKELIARAIHLMTERAGRPFVPLDCAAIPEGLMESQLFGHVRGAFTNAVADTPGVFEQANHGTLFLDEVGELSLSLQVKLLRVLQMREFRRVGGTSPIKVDVRVIAATNKDLALAVKDKTFREDLFFRLNVVSLHLPPLRSRKEDIPLLVQHFIKKLNGKNRRAIARITSQAMGLLLKQDWPGNVRELENCIERAAVLADGEEITVKDLVPFVSGENGHLSPSHRTASLREMERDYVLQVLRSVDGNRTKAAQVLGISLRGLQYKLKQYAESGAHVPSLGASDPDPPL
jgi:DNA-binding NtrC family response regulator